MGKYELTMSDIDLGVKRILAEAYATVPVSDNPELVYISAGPGAGKTALEIYLKKKFREKGERAFDINSDKIAMFHPQYEDALEELPEECYKITRKFVRPATPKIFEELRKSKINIINENTLDKGDSDIENAKKFKESGYRISVNIIATDLFESRLSCYEREANQLLIGETPRGCSKETQERMYNSFIDEVKELDSLGLLDDIRVYIRGENLSKPPILKYQKGDTERKKQRNSLLKDPAKYLQRIKDAETIINKHSVNKVNKKAALHGLKELEEEYIEELTKSKEER